MKDNFEIKVDTGYDKHIFYTRDNNLDITSNSDILSMYPVKIELKTYKDEEYREELEVFNPNLFYLSEIFVEEEYRKEGYCNMLINKLDEILMYIAKLNVGVIATRIYEYETLNNIDSIEKLTKAEKQNLNKNLVNMLIDNDYMLLENEDNYLVKVLY